MKSISIYAVTRNQNIGQLQKLERQLSGREYFLKMRTWELESMKSLVRELEAHMDEILELDQEACEHIAEKNCSIKYHVVMQDERELGLREVLNLGHTVGRAVETVSDYRLLHGEAVSIGLVAEARLAQNMGYLSEADAERVIALLKRAKLPTEIPEYIDREALVKKLYTDKKVRDGKLRFVIQDGIGAIATFGENVYASPISEEKAREIIMQL